VSILDEVRFRSSPFVALKRLDDLGASEREAFAELESDPDFFGLLVPRPPLSMNVKSAGRQTAELFQKLVTPATLDPSLLADAESAGDVVDLVLDGVLEVEHGDGFVSGADAFSVLCSPSGFDEGSDAVARLSHDALLHAQDLETAVPQELINALYLYNRIPLTPFWRTRFSSAEAILAHLGADRGPLRALLEREWSMTARGRGWISWSSRSAEARQSDAVTWKLYVSVRPERLRDAFEVVVRVLADFPGVPFKIGDSATGLLRPDKMVTYFWTREALEEAAAILHRELAGCDAQGVPFSAGLDAEGLLSWGVDPPDTDRALQWLGRDSWRLWVAKRLGAAMSIAKSARGANAIEPWRFAVERARRHGVDVSTWTPSPTLWSRP
jgi:hypothetical protein